ncbi:MAG TPA: LD-carboxypeptidase [Burkholderiaceae bacterium]|nr:LD-carboxypeptidase [Burkholderiaceae bacterium]
MSHIYVYSPSSRVVDKAAFKRGIKRLQFLGHEVEIDPDALTGHLRFAGDDRTRLAAIQRAAASGADVALTSRGGYGLSRILPHLPYKAIAKAVERGTQFVGYSDFTALQCALLATTQINTWAGPSVCGDFGQQVEKDGAPDVVMESCFDDLLQGQGEGVGWRATNNIALQAINTPVNDNIKGQNGTIKSEFTVRNATLWGGNLTMLNSLVGTPYMPAVASDKKQRGMLFIEDVADHPYRIERNLTQLLHAGVLHNQKAILFGQFTNYQLFPKADHGFKLQSVIDWLRSAVKCPVITGLPMGHVPTKVLLPFGVKATLNVDGRDAMLVWGD